ncbi:unnamed protein product [Prorocentrum cordatum]|uniref:Peptidase A1 domain-containing protein n=1 Tax=Prorocentrum cordatum TaxID=2364126 RepID=A0ABN9TBD2_9DINO|nr:unnamed protein product [Polarella glacialis]
MARVAAEPSHRAGLCGPRRRSAAVVAQASECAGELSRTVRQGADPPQRPGMCGQVGEQTIAGVFDTGSFELLVFGEECTTCGKAVGYHHSSSRTFLLGNHTETHSFGSGTCQSRDAYDEVHVGPFDAMAFPFWEVVLAQMPVLRQANFQAIVGIGPPGEPVSTAEAAVEDFDAE